MSRANQLLKHSCCQVASRCCVALLFIAFGCLEPYNAPVTADIKALVVDGFINSTNGLVKVTLSRTQQLDATTPYPVEPGAQVQVEDENGNRFSVPEILPGRYQVQRNNLAIGTRYRLLITTQFAEEYASDFVALKQSPLLEDVFWVAEDGGITIKIDTRDPTGATRYYQWVYTETWEYESDRSSGFIVRNGQAVPRRQDERINICYSTVGSSKVLISTTADQSGDFINDFALVHIPRGSKKVSRTYSIVVEQRALDEKSYSYWQQLQRTTENLGGLFDPLPSRVTGNVHAINVQALALGYFTGGGVEEKRIYIRNRDLPEALRIVHTKPCPVDSLPHSSVQRLVDGTPLLGPYGSPLPFGYTKASASCVDCRLEGGVLTKPSFWPN
jgi:hypothetical protein